MSVLSVGAGPNHVNQLVLPALFFLYQDQLAVLGPLSFPTNSGISFSISAEKPDGMLRGMIANPQISWGVSASQLHEVLCSMNRGYLSFSFRSSFLISFADAAGFVQQ